MKNGILALSFAAGLVFAQGAAVSASAQSTAAAKKPHAHRNAPADAGYVACTFLGCARIPAKCRPATDYYPDGMPTGYDAVICPNGKFYSRS